MVDRPLQGLILISEPPTRNEFRSGFHCSVVIDDIEMIELHNVKYYNLAASLMPGNNLDVNILLGFPYRDSYLQSSIQCQ